MRDEFCQCRVGCVYVVECAVVRVVFFEVVGVDLGYFDRVWCVELDEDPVVVWGGAFAVCLPVVVYVLGVGW